MSTFDYIAPTEQSIEAIKETRQSIISLEEILKKNIKPSRELSLAITKLEEVYMWANKGIVTTQD